MAERAFIPAAGHDRWLPLYDPLTRLLGARSALAHLVELAAPGAGERVLDLGCGTGTLVVLMAAHCPGLIITALDPDPNALARTRCKVQRAGFDATIVQGYADAIAAPDAAFDLVVTSFMLHHLEPAGRHAALADAHRVLRPGGRLFALDFAPPGTRSRGRIARLLHGDDDLGHTPAQLLDAELTAAGFERARRIAERDTLFGPVEFVSGYKGAEAHTTH